MSIAVSPLSVSGLLLIRPARLGDTRGWFSETFNRFALEAHGIRFDPVQENVAFSAEANVVRGLHAQAPPSAQAKLVRASKGRVFDVAVDARAGSPTYGRWTSAELTAENGEMLFVPKGFLHGYATRDPGCEVTYLVDAPYAPQDELRVRWDDPDLAIAWCVDPDAAVLSATDRTAGAWGAFRTPFRT